MGFSGPGTPSSPPNVILITIDGVGWNEVFEGSDPEFTGQPAQPVMPHLTGDLASEGLLLGDLKGSRVEVSNSRNMSLPGYQSIFVGHPTQCEGNLCREVKEETFVESLQKRHGLGNKQLAGFASWGALNWAFAQKGSDIYLNAGLEPSRLGGPVHSRLDEAQKRTVPGWSRPPFWHARFDHFTFAHAFEFLKNHHPRFMLISLLDADEYAHAGNYPAYVDALKKNDGWIRQVADYLDSSGEYGANTLLIVTTDHGRGRGGDAWRSHGKDFPDSKLIWMYLRGRGVRAGGSPFPKGTVLNHDAIRRLVENTFDSKPDVLEGMLAR